MTVTFAIGVSELNDATLEEMIAERAIRNQIHNYSRAQDRFDVGLFMSVCHPDCIIDYGGNGGPQGPAIDAITLFNTNHARWAAHTHQVTNIVIKVKGDKAVSETYVHATLRGFPDESRRAEDMHSRGRYLDHWSKRDGRWALDHRLLISEFGWIQQAEHAQVGARGNPRRDRTDPVYAAFEALVD